MMPHIFMRWITRVVDVAAGAFLAPVSFCAAERIMARRRPEGETEPGRESLAAAGA